MSVMQCYLTDMTDHVGSYGSHNFWQAHTLTFVWGHAFSLRTARISWEPMLRMRATLSVFAQRDVLLVLQWYARTQSFRYLYPMFWNLKGQFIPFYM